MVLFTPNDVLNGIEYVLGKRARDAAEALVRNPDDPGGAFGPPFEYDPDPRAPEGNNEVNGSGPYRPINEQLRHEPKDDDITTQRELDGSRFDIAFVPAGFTDARYPPRWPELNDPQVDPFRSYDLKIMLWDRRACGLQHNYVVAEQFVQLRNSEYHIVHEANADGGAPLAREVFRARYHRRRYIEGRGVRMATWNPEQGNTTQVRNGNQQVARERPGGSEWRPGQAPDEGTERSDRSDDNERPNDRNNYAPHRLLCHMILWQLSADDEPICATRPEVQGAYGRFGREALSPDHPLTRFFNVGTGGVSEPTRQYNRRRLRHATDDVIRNVPGVRRLYAQADVTAVWGLQRSRRKHAVLWYRAAHGGQWQSRCIEMTRDPAQVAFNNDGWTVAVPSVGFEPPPAANPLTIAANPNARQPGQPQAPRPARTDCKRWVHPMRKNEPFGAEQRHTIRIYTEDQGATWKCAFNGAPCGVFRFVQSLRDGLHKDMPVSIAWPNVDRNAVDRCGNAMLWFDDQFAAALRAALRAPTDKDMEQEKLKEDEEWVGNHSVFHHVQDNQPVDLNDRQGGRINGRPLTNGDVVDPTMQEKIDKRKREERAAEKKAADDQKNAEKKAAADQKQAENAQKAADKAADAAQKAADKAAAAAEKTRLAKAAEARRRRERRDREERTRAERERVRQAKAAEAKAAEKRREAMQVAKDARINKARNAAAKQKAATDAAKAATKAAADLKKQEQALEAKEKRLEIELEAKQQAQDKKVAAEAAEKRRQAADKLELQRRAEEAKKAAAKVLADAKLAAQAAKEAAAQAKLDAKLAKDERIAKDKAAFAAKQKEDKLRADILDAALNRAVVEKRKKELALQITRARAQAEGAAALKAREDRLAEEAEEAATRVREREAALNAAAKRAEAAIAKERAAEAEMYRAAEEAEAAAAEAAARRDEARAYQEAKEAEAVAAADDARAAEANAAAEEARRQREQANADEALAAEWAAQEGGEEEEQQQQQEPAAAEEGETRPMTREEQEELLGSQSDDDMEVEAPPAVAPAPAPTPKPKPKPKPAAPPAAPDDDEDDDDEDDDGTPPPPRRSTRVPKPAAPAAREKLSSAQMEALKKNMGKADGKRAQELYDALEALDADDLLSQDEYEDLLDTYDAVVWTNVLLLAGVDREEARKLNAQRTKEKISDLFLRPLTGGAPPPNQSDEDSEESEGSDDSRDSDFASGSEAMGSTDDEGDPEEAGPILDVDTTEPGSPTAPFQPPSSEFEPNPGVDYDCPPDSKGPRRKGIGTNTLSVGDQGKTLVFVSSDGRPFAIEAWQFWGLVTEVGAPAATAAGGIKDPCNYGRWYRQRFFEKANNKEAAPGVTWQQVIDEWLYSDRATPSQWQSPYPLWVEDRLLTKLIAAGN